MTSLVLCLNPMLDPAGATLLREAGHRVEVVDAGDPMAVDAMLPQADAIIVRLPAFLDASRIGAARRARIIAASGAGTDHIDVAAAAARGIGVVNNPGAGATAVAEHAVGLMLAVAKRLPLAGAMLRAQGWAAREFFHRDPMNVDLDGAVLGLVGFGAIAQEVARICRHGFRMDILACVRPGGEAACEAAGVAWSHSLPDICGRADFLSVHIPATPDTVRYVDAAAIAALRPHAILINTARGPVVDEGALYEALLAGRIGGAGLDVFEQEPLPAAHRLLALANVVATPHVAGISQAACRRLSLSAAGQVAQALAGVRPAHLVDPAAWRPPG